MTPDKVSDTSAWITFLHVLASIEWSDFFALAISSASFFFAYKTWLHSYSAEQKRIRLRHQTHLLLLIYRNISCVIPKVRSYATVATAHVVYATPVHKPTDEGTRAVRQLANQIINFMLLLAEPEMRTPKMRLIDFLKCRAKAEDFTADDLEALRVTLKRSLFLLRTYFVDPDFTSVIATERDEDDEFIDLEIDLEMKNDEVIKTFIGDAVNLTSDVYVKKLLDFQEKESWFPYTKKKK